MRYFLQVHYSVTNAESANAVFNSFKGIVIFFSPGLYLYMMRLVVEYLCSWCPQ